jgi:hypothetical protein
MAGQVGHHVRNIHRINGDVGELGVIQSLFHTAGAGDVPLLADQQQDSTAIVGTRAKHANSVAGGVDHPAAGASGGDLLQGVGNLAGIGGEIEDSANAMIECNHCHLAGLANDERVQQIPHLLNLRKDVLHHVVGLDRDHQGDGTVGHIDRDSLRVLIIVEGKVAGLQSGDEIATLSVTVVGATTTFTGTLIMSSADGGSWLAGSSWFDGDCWFEGDCCARAPAKKAHNNNTALREMVCIRSGMLRSAFQKIDDMRGEFGHRRE